MAERRNSNSQLLEELDALSQSLYQSHTARRTASLALPRSADASEARSESKPRTRRMSLSPWRSRPGEGKDGSKTAPPEKFASEIKKLDTSAAGEKKGIWNWKPIRAISHLAMQRISCLFSVEVVAIQGLPASMNGLRLAVCVRKKETKEGSVQTMPARVLQGAADFEEMLFIRCHVYCTGGGGAEKQLKFEPRPFLIYVVAVDAEELHFGRCLVDLSALVQESMEKNLEGTRVRQWDTSFDLAGKAKGGEMVLKLGFQIVDDKGVGIYSQGENQKPGKHKDSSLFSRKQTKTSFSVTSPRITGRSEARTPSRALRGAELQTIDDLDLDEPPPVPSSSQKSDPPAKADDIDLPEFDVVDKGIEEIEQREEKKEEPEVDSKEAIDEESVSSEVVKEVVHDPSHWRRQTELDAIAEQIKALESLIRDDDSGKKEKESEMQRLDAEEETVTKEFLQMLEAEEEEAGGKFKLRLPEVPSFRLETDGTGTESEAKVFVPDLGKGLGSVVQTRDGGYLASMNPFNIEVSRKETPKLAMQVSRPLVLPSAGAGAGAGIELFQKLAGAGAEELRSKILSTAAMDELMRKTAEQIAFEGVASAIIQGRSREGASSSAARSIAAVKSMVSAMSAGRKERVSTGIWNAGEKVVAPEEILPFAVQKIEAMAVEALKIQAELTEEEPPFDISPAGESDARTLLESARPLEDWIRGSGDDRKSVAVMVVVQLRDPLRRYEVVGGPAVAIVQASAAAEAAGKEERFKVASLHVGGLRVRGRRQGWDGERHRLTAMQWLLAYGLGKAPKKERQVRSEAPQEVVWSISARVVADMWLKPLRNPDVKLLV